MDKFLLLLGFIILVVYRSLIDGGYSHKTTPLAGPRVFFRRADRTSTLLAGPSCRVFSAKRTSVPETPEVSQSSCDIHLRTGKSFGPRALALTSTLYKVGCPLALVASSSNLSCSFVTSFEYFDFIIILQTCDTDMEWSQSYQFYDVASGCQNLTGTSLTLITQPSTIFVANVRIRDVLLDQCGKVLQATS